MIDCNTLTQEGTFHSLEQVLTLGHTINSFMTEAVIINQWTSFHMITASAMKEFSWKIRDTEISQA